jgi:hypothetical protein
LIRHEAVPLLLRTLARHETGAAALTRPCPARVGAAALVAPCSTRISAAAIMVFSKCSSVIKLAALDAAPNPLMSRLLQGHAGHRTQGQRCFRTEKSPIRITMEFTR